ncbi:MAG TPA: hypothetical protein VGQ17_12875 [Gemmatimonadales bacterium]|nr:hypothetical protein [Gemmatimonadales bacterium]
MIAALLCQACGASETLAPVGDRVLPASLRLLAEAAGTDAGKDIQCSLDILVRLEGAIDRSTHRLIQHGTGGGEARRGWVLPAGNGISFWADLFIADLEIHLIGADSVELRSPASMADTESRFWHELGLLPGHTRNANPATGELADGTWTCRPMDTPRSSGEYFDSTGTVAGTWRLLAAP